jgi:hypothetical protein
VTFLRALPLKEKAIEKKDARTSGFRESCSTHTFFVGVCVRSAACPCQFFRVLLARAAAQNSRCLAQDLPPEKCSSEVRKQIENHYALKNPTVSSSIVHGTIHTEVRAKFIGGFPIVARFDLLPSEYKRKGP